LQAAFGARHADLGREREREGGREGREVVNKAAV